MKPVQTEFLKKFIVSNRIILLVLISSFFLAIVWSHNDSQHTEPPTTEEVITLDTLIPEGFSLVNIEIVNAEKLEAILGQFGIVDLFLASEEGKRTSKKIASRVKILRAPKNPQEFAVLVPDAKVSELFSYNAPFFASIQNPIPNESNKVSNFENRTRRVSRITRE